MPPIPPSNRTNLKNVMTLITQQVPSISFNEFIKAIRMGQSSSKFVPTQYSHDILQFVQQILFLDTPRKCETSHICSVLRLAFNRHIMNQPQLSGIGQLFRLCVQMCIVWVIKLFVPQSCTLGHKSGFGQSTTMHISNLY